MDVVYPVRAGDNNGELQYSLRSLHTNYPNLGRVWIVGYQPNWVTNVKFIPGNGFRPHANVYRNILAACEHPDVPDEFLLMNDDFFFTEPVDTVVPAYKCRLVDQVAKARKPYNWWSASVASALKCLLDAGIDDPLSYELHMPLPVRKAGMAETLRRFVDVDEVNPPQWRTLYGNMCGIGGVQRPDCKIRRRFEPVNTPFHSTSDSTWRYYAPYFRRAFPHSCPYEKAT